MTSKSLSKTKGLWIHESKSRDVETTLAGEMGQIGRKRWVLGPAPGGAWEPS